MVAPVSLSFRHSGVFVVPQLAHTLCTAAPARACARAWVRVRARVRGHTPRLQGAHWARTAERAFIVARLLVHIRGACVSGCICVHVCVYTPARVHVFICARSTGPSMGGPP